MHVHNHATHMTTIWCINHCVNTAGSLFKVSNKSILKIFSMTWLKPKVPFRDLRHFMHKACVTSVNAEANAHSADWLMSVFVNELTLPHVRSQQGQCVQQCRGIMKETLVDLKNKWIKNRLIADRVTWTRKQIEVRRILRFVKSARAWSQFAKLVRKTPSQIINYAAIRNLRGLHSCLIAWRFRDSAYRLPLEPLLDVMLLVYYYSWHTIV